MKKIAVCGYSSGVGKYFLEYYKKYYNFVLIGRKQPNVYLDLRNRIVKDEELAALEHCDAMVNFAAQVEDRSYIDIENMVQTNVLGPLFLAELVKKYKIGKLIHISSISALYESGDPYYSYYSQTKKSADDLLTMFCISSGIPLCILRPSALFGTIEFQKHQKLLYAMIQSVKNKTPVYIYGSRDSKRNYIHVSTLTDVICKSIESDISGTYNVVNLKDSMLTEIVDSLNMFYSGVSKVVFLPDKPDVIELALNDKGEIYAKLGIDPPRSFEEEIKKGMDL